MYKAMHKVMEAKHEAKKRKRAEVDCAVCLNEHEMADMRVWPCGHMFCKECTPRLMGINRTCAVCKDKVPLGSKGPVKVFGV
jgi:hypothetical protein